MKNLIETTHVSPRLTTNIVTRTADEFSISSVGNFESNYRTLRRHRALKLIHTLTYTPT
jgi:hypothetical protein